MKKLSSYLANLIDPSAGYSEGQIKDDPGNLTGSEIRAQMWNDIFYAIMAFITKWWSISDTSENETSSDFRNAVENAIQTYSGLIEYSSGMAFTSGYRVKSPVPGDEKVYDIKVSGFASNTGVLIDDFLIDCEAGKIVSPFNLAKTIQTVYQGSTNSNGKANFLSASGSGVQLTASVIPVSLNFACGVVGGKEIYFEYSFKTDQNPSEWDGLSNGTYYLYVDFNNGVPVFDKSSLRPVYANTFPSGPASNQHAYLINEKKMYYYDGASWIPVKRVFVGEAVFSGGSPISVTTYALNGLYESNWIFIADAGTQPIFTESHNIGVALSQNVAVKHYFSLDSNGSDSSQAHDFIYYVDGGSSHYVGAHNAEDVANTSTHLYYKFGFKDYVQFYRNSLRVSGYYKLIFKRDF